MKPYDYSPVRRLRGTVKMWDDDKGFGFIAPENGGADVFLHMRALANRSFRPAVGAVVSYRGGTDDQQRPRAVEARLESSPPAGPATAPQRRPAKRAGSTGPGLWAEPKTQAGIGVAVFLGALTGAAALGYLSAWVPALYAVASSLTFTTYLLDKTRAENDGRRIPENTLHLLELLGGWPGALLAQQWLRHKTSKVAYQVIFWLIVAAHVGAWAWWIFALKKA